MCDFEAERSIILNIAQLQCPKILKYLNV